MIEPHIGLLCRSIRRSGFKLAIVVGGTQGRVRIRVWRANSSQWTQPQLVDLDTLQALTDEERQEHGATIKRASKALSLKELFA